MSTKKKARKVHTPHWWILVLVSSIFSTALVVHGVSAVWQNPTCDPNTNPDACNAAAPINVSEASQTKNGPLTITVGTGTNALTVNTGATGSPVALAVNSAGSGYGINVANSATGGALLINSTGAVTAATITQNQSGGTGLNVTVGGSTGGTAITAISTTSTSGQGVTGTGSQAGVQGIGATNGVGVFGQGAGTGSGVYGQIAAGGTGAAAYFDGASSGKALTTVNGQVNFTSSLAYTPTLNVDNPMTGATAASAITGNNQGSNSPAIYGYGLNYFGVSGVSGSFNYAGVMGCYGGSVNCGMLGSGTYAGYFNGKTLTEGSAQVNSIAAADSVQEYQLEGHLSDNSLTPWTVATSTYPYALESSGEYMWMCNRVATYVLQKLRPSDGKLVMSINMPAGVTCTDLLFDGDYIWVASDGASPGVVRVDAYTGVYTYYNLGAQIKGLGFDGGNVWATGYNTSQLFKVNRSTGAISATYATLGGGGPFGITVANGTVWWVNSNASGGKYYLSRINTDGTNQQNFPISVEAPLYLTFDGDNIWVPGSVGAPAKMSRFDIAHSTEATTVTLSEPIRDITFDDNFLWLSAPNTRRLYIYRPIDGTLVNNLNISSTSGSGVIERITFDGHAVWYSQSSDNLVGRYMLPWSDGYANGSVFQGISLYDSGTNSYTCVRSNGAGGVTAVAGLCP